APAKFVEVARPPITVERPVPRESTLPGLSIGWPIANADRYALKRFFLDRILQPKLAAVAHSARRLRGRVTEGANSACELFRTTQTTGSAYSAAVPRTLVCMMKVPLTDLPLNAAPCAACDRDRRAAALGLGALRQNAAQLRHRRARPRKDVWR